MEIDVANVLSGISKVAEETTNFSDGYKLVYPQDGELKVKLLFNPASQIVMRLVNRHIIGDERVPCLSQYGKPCPVCTVVNKIENVNPNMEDLWKYKNNRRAIMFAEYLSSSYSISADSKFQPQKGEVILLMVPYMVYADLTQILAKAGNDIVHYISENSGKVFSITRYREKGRVQYKVEEDTLIGLHATCQSDDEFDHLLLDLPNLNEKVVPEKVTPEIEEKAQRLANILEVEHFGGRASTFTRDTNTDFDKKFSNSNSQQSAFSQSEPESTIVDGKKYIKLDGKWVIDPSADNPQSAPNPSSNSDNPKCFGSFKENDPKCDICPQAWDCQEA